MKRKNIFRFIILPVMLLIAALGWYVYNEYNRTHKDTAALKTDYSLQATDLINEFLADEQASNQKYWDKVLVVEGMAKEITHDDNGIYTIAIGDTASMSAVRCNIDSAAGKSAAEILKGSRVAVKGICTGFNADELLGSDVILVRCVVDTKKSNLTIKKNNYETTIFFTADAVYRFISIIRTEIFYQDR
jgi:hypothetical protein